MASTNKTTNYELSQFVGSDKPAWLGDYNTDMAKIDAQMKLNADAATAAAGTGTANTAAIGTLSNLTTTEKSNLVGAVNEVNSTASTAQNTANAASTTANTAATTAQSAKNEADRLINQFNFTATEYDSSNTTISGATYASNAKFTVALNSDSTLLKIYGFFNINSTTPVNGNITIDLNVTGLTVLDTYTISPVGLTVKGDGANVNEVKPISATISNGHIKLTLTSGGTGLTNVSLTPCLYINKDFGDVIS